MKNTKIHSVLSQFDAYQLNRLDRFIRSPYFNQSEELTALFEQFYQHFKNDERLPQKRELWDQLHSDEVYKDSRFRKYCSDLLKLVEKFLAVEKFEENPLHEASYLIESVAENKLEKLYNSVMKSARTLSNKQDKKAANYFYHQYNIEKNYYDLSEAEIKRFEKLNLENIVSNLDKFYIGEKLKYVCVALSRKVINKYDYNILFIDEIIKHIESHVYENTPQISLYYAAYKLLMNPDSEKHFNNLRAEINENVYEFPQDEGRFIYDAALNFCIRKINKGNERYLKVALDLYEEFLESKYVFIKGYLSPWDFKNIVTIALRDERYDWSKEFIKTYAEKIDEPYRENAVKFNLARLHYHKHEYDRVIPLLNEVEFNEMSYNLSAKAILLATYYETDEFDLLHSFLDSFSTFIHRHKNELQDQWTKNYLNLIKYVRKLINLPPSDTESLEAMEREIDETKDIADIKWLKEKISERKNN